MGSRPRVPAAPPPPPPPPSLIDQQVLEARTAERKRQARLTGTRGTILTGPAGLGTNATLGYPTLLSGGVK
jgi:hypothetical protein